MYLTDKIRLTFARTTGFLTIPVTILLVLVYLAVALSTLITDQLPSVPSASTLHSHYGGLNVTEAYKDLQIIAARPHPYHSHANDIVREYLLQRLRNVRLQSGSRDNFIIDDDVITNGTWSSSFGVSGSGNYFEGNNILVKIRGTAEAESSNLAHPPLPAVLFSAHYDCVSTASGAVDDGIGVVTLLQLIQYFASHPPRRDVLFNINNGEEDGLNGAHILLEHPWIKNTSHIEYTNFFGSTFLNLEGAGSGGRPLMFRGTDHGSVKSWRNVENPHANIISAEAFNLGLIRSSTDYSVYNSRFAAPDPLDYAKFAPLRGLDFAFYRGRSKYHTKYDALPFIEGGDKALWAMLQPASAAGIALANDNNVSSDVNEKAVYFELFNSVLILLRLADLLTMNITALIVGPIVLILLAVSESALARSRAAKRQRATFSPSTGWAKAKHRFNTFSRVLWKHGRYWVALIIAIGAQIALVVGFVNLNPFVSFEKESLVLSPPLINGHVRILVLSQAPITTNVPAWEFFRTFLVHSYILSWLLVVLSTISITQFGLGGILYMASACNGLTWLAAVLCGIAGCFGVAETAELRLVHVFRDDTDVSEQEQEETEVNERTPLVGRKHLRVIKNKSKSGVDPVENPQPYVLWILVLLIYVPFPLILISHIAIFLINSVSQTMIDGSPAVTVYAVISLISLIASLPAIPFIGARRVHRYLFWILGLVWVVCIALAWIPWSGPWAGSVEGFKGGLFPFSEDAPLKVFFQQKVDLSPSGTDVNPTVRIVTTLTGATPFVHDLILPLIPSYLHSLASGRLVGCSDNNVDERKIGLANCNWETYNSNTTSFDALNMAHGKSMSFNETPGAQFSIMGNNSRACRIYFDQPVEKFRVRTASWGVQRGFESDHYNMLRLWTRAWAKKFVVDVQCQKPFFEETTTHTGRVACEWAEYESGMVGMGLSTSPIPSSSGERFSSAKIPAFEEVLTYLPKWAVVSKLTDGLVEVEERFVL
ncbi:putative zinc metalloprotease [Lentinula edodes]|nr:putative zinc metalloprotease [Lentinula edodes]